MHGHSLRRVARVSLPRSHRFRRAAQHEIEQNQKRNGERKRALKRSTMRACSRRCVYCASFLEYDVATLDHVYPRAKGGPHAAGNLVVACGRCNRRKGDLLPHEFFFRFPTAGLNFLAYARAVHRALKREARRAVSLAFARDPADAKAA